MNQVHRDATAAGMARAVFVALMAQSPLWICGGAQAESTSASFGVTIQLRTFSEAATSDHRCTHRGQAAGKETLRISCPTTVDVQAIANVASGWAMQHQRMSDAGPYQVDRYQFTAAAGPLPRTATPMELTIAW